MDSVKAPAGTQSVLRAIGLLKAFSREQPAMTLGELCAAERLTRTTGHRLLAALESEGLVARDPRGRYHLGSTVIALGARAALGHDLRAACRPVLERLARETGETATLEVLSEGRMLIVDEVSGRHLVTATPEVGTRWPVYATSTGKALLATLGAGERRRLLAPPLTRYTPSTLTDPEALERELDRVRARGWATAVEELEVGAAAVAAAVRDPLGRAVGAISIGGPVSRLTRRRLAALGRGLRRAAAGLPSRMEEA